MNQQIEIESKEIVFKYESESQNKQTLAFKKKINEIQKIQRENSELEETLLKIQNKVLTQSRPFILKFCEARIISLEALDEATEDPFFSKNERSQIVSMVIEGAEEIISLGDDRARVYIEKYLGRADDFFGDDFTNEKSDEFFKEHESFRSEKAPRKKLESENSGKEEFKSLYRSLAKSIHPDREQDETAKIEKTILMQRLTKAYNENNIYDLLILQAQTTGNQILSDKQIALYIKKLNSQVKELKLKKKELTDYGRLAPVYRTFYSKKESIVENKIRTEMEMIENRVWQEQAYCDLFLNKKRFRLFLKEEKKSKIKTRVDDDLVEEFFDELFDKITKNSAPLNKAKAKTRH